MHACAKLGIKLRAKDYSQESKWKMQSSACIIKVYMHYLLCATQRRNKPIDDNLVRLVIETELP